LDALVLKSKINSAVFIWLGLIACCLLYILNIREPSVDPFHTGEFFVAAVNLENGLSSITIHGMVNYLPALITHYFYGDDQYIIPTVYVIKTLALFSSLILALTCYELLKKNSRKNEITAAIFIVSLGFITHRDLFLALSLYTFLRILNSLKKEPKKSLEITFGVVMAFTLFWAFDRGLSAVLAIGSAAVFYMISQKSMAFISSIIAFASTLIILHYSFDITSIDHYVGNIVSLVKSSSQWQYELSWRVAWFTLAATILLLIGWLNIFLAIRDSDNGESKAFLFALFLMSIIIFKSSINRADLVHIVFSLIPLMYVFAYRLGANQSIILPTHFLGSTLSRAIFFSALIIFSIVFKAVTILIFCALLWLLLGQSERLNRFLLVSIISLSACLMLIKIIDSDKIKYLFNKNDKYSIASKGNVWVAKFLISHNTRCVLDMTNNGIINALTQLPSCTEFAYPVYAPTADDINLKEAFLNNQPNAVVYDSGFWSYKIDRKKMSDRYPILNKALLGKYKNKTCEFHYCILYN